jgi:hypothetical protein
MPVELPDHDAGDRALVDRGHHPLGAWTVEVRPGEAVVDHLLRGRDAHHPQHGAAAVQLGVERALLVGADAGVGDPGLRGGHGGARNVVSPVSRSRRQAAWPATVCSWYLNDKPKTIAEASRAVASTTADQSGTFDLVLPSMVAS